LELADGIAQAKITHANITTLDLGHHSESIELFITTLSPKHPIVLGTPWLRMHNPVIDWFQNTLTFGSLRCKTRCLPWKSQSTTILPTPSDTEDLSNYQPPSFEEVEDYEDLSTNQEGLIPMTAANIFQKETESDIFNTPESEPKRAHLAERRLVVVGGQRRSRPPLRKRVPQGKNTRWATAGGNNI